MLNYSYASSPGDSSGRPARGNKHANHHHRQSPESKPSATKSRSMARLAEKLRAGGSPSRSPDRLNWSRLSTASGKGELQHTSSSVFPVQHQQGQQQPYSPIAVGKPPGASENQQQPTTTSVPTHRRRISNSISLLSLSRLSGRSMQQHSHQQADENSAFDASLLNESHISRQSTVGGSPYASYLDASNNNNVSGIASRSRRLSNLSPQKMDASLVEESKRREHEQTLLAYVNQLKSDLEHERQLVKNLLVQERAYKDQEARLRRELTTEKGRCRILAERLLRLRHQVEVQTRDLARALNDLEGWRRLAEKTTSRQQELEFECEQQASMLIEQASFFSQKNAPTTPRKTFSKGKLSLQAHGIMGRIMSIRKGLGQSRSFKGESKAFESMRQDLERLRLENIQMRKELVRMAKDRQEEELCADLDLAVEQFLSSEDLDSSLVRSFAQQ